MDWSVVFSPENTWQLITAGLGIVVILLGILAKHLAGKYKRPVKEIAEAIEAYRQGKHPASELGVKLSPREKATIKDETIDVIEVIVREVTGGLLERGLLIIVGALRKLKFW